MSETALGRLGTLKKRELEIAATKMTTPEMNALIKQLQQKIKDQLAAPANSVCRTVVVEETVEERGYGIVLRLYCRAILTLRKMEAEGSILDICLRVLQVITELRC